MLPIRVGVVSPSLFNIKKIEEYRYWGIALELKDWCYVKVVGADAFSWLQRQLAQNISEINIEGKPIVRLDRSAKIKYFGILTKSNDELYRLFIPKVLIDNFKEDFEKFVIMEEISYSISSSEKLALVIGPNDNGDRVDFFGEQGSIISSVGEIGANVNAYMKLAGHPEWGVNITGNELVNETRLNEVAVDYNKGCFLGQETAAKIQTRRGANYYPVILEINDKEVEVGELFVDGGKIGELNEVYINGEECLGIGRLKREFRIIDATHKVEINKKIIDIKVTKLPYFKDLKNIEKAKTLYFNAIKEFEKNNEEDALKMLKRSTVFDPTFSDAFEVIGVIHARNGQHLKTIEWMDKLLVSDSTSVMAHTNKSLAYMNLGEIEKAEEEKALATTKSFAMYGAEAKKKKETSEIEQKENAEILRRESMFLQVLNIDSNDQIALYGMADIKFKRGSESDALSYLEKSLIANPKHSQSYLLKGKILEKLNNVQAAKNVYIDGIKVAASQGELMPANEMQSRLNRLSVSQD